jgi:hypothetical protein
MSRADTCTDRKEAIHLINKATKLMEKINKQH